MKTAIQFLCAASLLAILLSGCRANAGKSNATEATTQPPTQATTVPTTAPTTLPTVAETIPLEPSDAENQETIQGATVPDARSGLADENGKLSDSAESVK